MCCSSAGPGSPKAKRSHHPSRGRTLSLDSFFFEARSSSDVSPPDCGVHIFFHVSVPPKVGGPRPLLEGRKEHIADEARDDVVEPRRSRRRVGFSTVTVRRHRPVIGDSPSCTVGLPLAIGWEHSPPASEGVDDYEARRGRRKTHDEMKLSRRERRRILSEVGGFSDRELHRAERRILIRERAEFFGVSEDKIRV